MNLANGLHVLGRSAFRHPWRIVVSWVVILTALGLVAAHYYQPTSTSVSIPGTPAQQAIDRVSALFPSNGGGSGRIVFHSLNGTKITDYKSVIDSVVSKIKGVDGVSQAVSPFVDPSFVSKSGSIAYSQVALTKQATETTEKTFTDITAIVKNARTTNLQIEIGGDLISKQPGEFIGAGEIGGVVVALFVLIVTLGSIVAAGMPLLSAILGIGVSMAGLFALSQVIHISSTTPVLAIMLGLAVGIDYALFIINKYRGYVLQGATYESAIARALGTAGNAVVFAATTVIIALSALSVVQIPFMTTMGLAGAGSIAVAAIMALSLTPALLRVGGRMVFPRKYRAVVSQSQQIKKTAEPLKIQPGTLWYKWGAFIVKHPVPILIVAVIAIAVVALPARQLTLGLPTDQYAPASSSQKKAYELLSDGFGVGFNGPLILVVEGLPTVSNADRDAIRQPALAAYNAQAAAAAVQAQRQYAHALAAATTTAERTAIQQQAAAQQAAGAQQQAAALAKIDETVSQYAKYVQLQKVAAKIGGIKDVEKVSPAVVTNDGTAGIIQVIPKTAPVSAATKDLIASLRSSAIVTSVTSNNGARLGVTGTTALQEDINAKLSSAMPLYLLVVVGLSLILLIVAFRSILVPLKATFGFLLSVLAMFGAMVAVFQWGWFGITTATGPIVSFIPIIAIGILFGLAMDYEFFLVSSMHEAHSKARSAKVAVVMGFGAGSKVVTAAAIIMISVFTGFIANHDSTIQSIGFGLAFGILVDAFIVRLTIVPAVMSLLGNAAWWLPRWIEKWVPHVSIEGEAEKD